VQGVEGAMANQYVSIGGPPSARGLALLFGWTGGQLRHVSKHASIWHRLGWKTVTALNTVDM
jgi:hypothetical protein